MRPTFIEATSGLQVLTLDELKKFNKIFPSTSVFPDHFENGFSSELIDDMLDMIKPRHPAPDAVNALLVWAEAFAQLSTETYNEKNEKYSAARELFTKILEGKDAISEKSRLSLRDFNVGIKPELTLIRSVGIGIYDFDVEIDAVLKNGRIGKLIAAIDKHASNKFLYGTYSRDDQKNADFLLMVLYHKFFLMLKGVVNNEFQEGFIKKGLIEKLNKSITDIASMIAGPELPKPVPGVVREVGVSLAASSGPRFLGRVQRRHVASSDDAGVELQALPPQ